MRKWFFVLLLPGCATFSDYVRREEKALKDAPYYALSDDEYPRLVRGCGEIPSQYRSRCLAGSVEAAVKQLTQRYPAASVVEVDEAITRQGRETKAKELEAKLDPRFDDLATVHEDAKFLVAWVLMLEENFREAHAFNAAKKHYVADQEAAARNAAAFQAISNSLNQMSTTIRLQQIEDRQRNIESQQRNIEYQQRYNRAMDQYRQNGGIMPIVPR